MKYLKFNKNELVNLEYSLKREVLSTNRAGGYLNTTICGCNTRKYHGLMVLPLKEFNNERHLLLSSLDESLIQYEQSFNLGIHQYGQTFEPKGHKYIRNLEIDKSLITTYRVGGVIFEKEIVFCDDEHRILIKYTLLDAHSPTKLRIKPFLAFRNIHALTTANMVANTAYADIQRGKKFCLYSGFPYLHIQLGVDSEYIHNPHWYYGVEYAEELRRGYECREDLFVPGYFELPIEKDMPVILSVSLKEENPADFAEDLLYAMSRRLSIDSFEHCLVNAARQFLFDDGKSKMICSGYPWLYFNLEDALVSLPGLTLFSENNIAGFVDEIDSLVNDKERRVLGVECDAIAPLWIFRILQIFSEYTGGCDIVRDRYGDFMLVILNAYLNNHFGKVELAENGLLRSNGYDLTTNSLWYNAIRFVKECFKDHKDDNFSSMESKIDELQLLMDTSFMQLFWSEERGYLADYVGEDGADWELRPYQILTCSFGYSPLNEEESGRILQRVAKDLLTNRGLRTMSPESEHYYALYDGDESIRDYAYNHGATRLWLLAPYIEANLKLYGKAFLTKAEDLIASLEEDLSTHCVGSLAEVYDGDPPHYPHGCPAFSRSVAELLRAIRMVERYKI